MARKKKIKVKGNLWQRVKGSLEPQQWQWLGRRLAQLVIVVAMGTGSVYGLLYLEGYVRQVHAERGVQLKVMLKDRPVWATAELIEDICLSSGIRSDDALLDDNLTRRWSKNLMANPWVKQVKEVRKYYDGLVELDCQLREPLAAVADQKGRHFIDVEGVVLPAVPLADGEVVELIGNFRSLPAPGKPVENEEIMAGLEVLALIRQVDENLPAKERLWRELAMLDVSNFKGRRYADQPHLKLFTQNHTEIRWGAAVNQERALYEASATEKLKTLYRKHRLYGTLDKFISVELRDRRVERADPLREG